MNPVLNVVIQVMRHVRFCCRSTSVRKNWKFWTMFWLPSMRKHGRRRSWEGSVRISVTRLQRMRRESGICSRRKASQKRKSSSFSVFYIHISHIRRALDCTMTSLQEF
ncbi:hypothetical protein NE237_032163 [Protea cynaroides]|uniref:Uncharacterized protein n=1 Tax=Protea cynaroides TaxID=273540 RepID=A0A9Q0L307_9MAGN|nr:hypothetical protein NE237_032163 [Protea cynaroides]